MLRRSLRFGSIAGALIGVMLLVSACDDVATSAAGVSGTCTQPTTVHEGSVLSGGVYFSIRSQVNPTDPRVTWVCYRVKAGSEIDHAGRVDVRSHSVVVREPSTDTNTRSCATGANNLIPPPHPIEEGAVGEVPFYVDAYVTLGNVWLCLEAGTIKQRIVVPVSTVEGPQVKLIQDSAPPPPPRAVTPATGRPSSSCYAGTHGPANELVNTKQGPRELYLYSAQPSPTELHLCARLSGPQTAGGHLAVNAAPGQVVRLEQSTDTTPCTTNVITLSNPPTSIKLSPVGQNPQSICVSGTRYSVVTGPVPAVVRWTPDP